MKKTLAILAVVVAAGVLAAVYFTREPSADGRTLSEWLRYGLEIRFNRDTTEVTNAVRKIGAKAVPILLDKLGVTMPAWKDALVGSRLKRFFSDDFLYDSYHQNEQALYGFSILGTQAVSALPELSRRLFDTNRPGTGLSTLGLIGLESLPVLKDALTNHNLEIRRRAVAGIVATPEVARHFIPEILALRQETQVVMPIIALGRIGDLLPEAESLPIAVEFLQDPRMIIQRDALRVMAHVRTNSPVAVPLVLPFLTNSNASLRRQATNTLKQIDPVSAAAHSVNTNRN